MTSTPRRRAAPRRPGTELTGRLRRVAADERKAYGRSIPSLVQRHPHPRQMKRAWRPSSTCGRRGHTARRAPS
ncbi:hypothetical protein N177_2925 [Lutibaculum baratangense AMV1]|uniref:Uncharacterized protein n=1 Tax=Lutibaculum baratangense AMV1 TaxID=631454 RepID=V4RKB1_9HYPH|nr:hypothetical protein N177_2925 [Lutibaculum baratangense AMV1]